MMTILTFLKTLFATPKILTSVAVTGGIAATIYAFRKVQFCADLTTIAIPAIVTVAIAYFIIQLRRKP